MVAINEKLMPGAERQHLPASDYYLLQDTLYRAAALTNSSGNVVEAYDCDAYGNTITFTAPDSSGNWWSDSATQSSFGANEIIFCGYRYDPETENYYVRNRYYSPTLGRWLQRDPIGYQGGINLYEYVGGDPAGNVDPTAYASSLDRYLYWNHLADFFRSPRILSLYHKNPDDELMLRALNLAARIKASDALQEFSARHHGQSPEQWLRRLEKAVNKASKLCPSQGLKNAEKALSNLKRVLSALHTAGQLQSANPVEQIKGLGNALGELGSSLGPESGAGPILKFYGKALARAASGIGQLYQLAAANNLGSWGRGEGELHPYASVPFSGRWAAQVMQSAGQTLGPSQPAFERAIGGTPYVVPGGIHG